MLLGLLLFPGAVAAKTVTVPFWSLPQVSTAKAIGLLNRQRAESGIPGDLTVEPRLSRGCRERVGVYKELPGQFPHTELPGRPGYSVLGKEAAGSSALSLGGGAGEWTEIANPWSAAPLHRMTLFSPSSTEAWYGEGTNGSNLNGVWGLGGACMGTGGAREFAEPTFFSVPGDGDRSVPPSEAAAEVPFTPGQAVGIPSGTRTGPTVLLYAEGSSALPESAKLTGPGSRVVPTKLVTDETWWSPTVGGVGNFVVIPRPLKPRTAYHLEVHWSGGERQRLSFSTLSTTAAVRRMAWGTSCVRLGTCEEGSLTVSLVGNRVRVSGHPVAHQPLLIQIRRGRLFCVVHARPCPKGSTRFIYDKQRTHRVNFDGHAHVHLPPPTSYGTAVEVHVLLEKFSFGGYHWVETPATIYRR